MTHGLTCFEVAEKERHAELARKERQIFAIAASFVAGMAVAIMLMMH